MLCAALGRGSWPSFHWNVRKAAKSAPWLAETAYDAGTAAVQTLAEGGSPSDAAKDAVLNSGIGGFITGYGKSQKARKNILKGRR